ncbi:ABC transporter permease [Enterococcus sp. LJL51]|uniref:ABC transporter permease n=1 Tax=Enterococcus sp. LJL51 TaxID=3416656 RepID=UPI003CF1534C
MRGLKTEIYRIVTSRSCKRAFFFLLAMQLLLAKIDAGNIIALGRHDTPETNPELASVMPTVEYYGFDALAYGIIVLLVFGAVSGAENFKHHELRTAFLYQGNRRLLTLYKLAAFLFVATGISFCAIFTTVSITHFFLGNEGLHPVLLSSISWQFILYGVLAWTLLAFLAFLLGLLFKNVAAPLLLLIPQVVGLGVVLLHYWNFGKYLPVAASYAIYSTPTGMMAHSPLMGTVTLLLWILLLFPSGFRSLSRQEIGGRY